jgi:hypothetical protein
MPEIMEHFKETFNSLLVLSNRIDERLENLGKRWDSDFARLKEDIRMLRMDTNVDFNEVRKDISELYSRSERLDKEFRQLVDKDQGYWKAWQQIVLIVFPVVSTLLSAWLVYTWGWQ